MPLLSQLSTTDATRQARIPDRLVAASLLLLLVSALSVQAVEHSVGKFTPREAAGFFKCHCVRCHGPDKSKAGLALHTLGAEPAAGPEVERWELILEMLESGAMPPEDEPQP
jgi:mono/diheme cytochrome c family protein